jgi:hypothetical protein
MSNNCNRAQASPKLNLIEHDSSFQKEYMITFHIGQRLCTHLKHARNKSKEGEMCQCSDILYILMIFYRKKGKTMDQCLNLKCDR